MNNAKPPSQRFYAVSHADEVPRQHEGGLIPNGQFFYTPKSLIPTQTKKTPVLLLAAPAIQLIGSVLLLGAIVGSSFAFLDGRQLIASLSTPVAPVVVIEHPYTGEQQPLQYGINVTFTESVFFEEARNAFISDERSFLEADLHAMELRYFESGVLAIEVPILAKGQKGSWRETPAGLYAVSQKNLKQFSNLEQIYHPWSLGFQGNFFIHGWPRAKDDMPVGPEYTGGGIRLSDEDAKRVYEKVAVATPILVYERPVTTSDFVYEPKIPELATPHYLIADIDNNTVLASSDLTAPAPIASITKLMTAVVAVESLNLEDYIPVSELSLVQSMIPRLQDRTRVSLYSLLQLVLVESSNEASEAIAAELGRDLFIQRMNEKARAIGMTDTVFADPSGLSSDNVSTVRDLLRLLQHLAHHRQFIIDLTRNQYLATSYVGDDFGTLQNFNTIVGTDNFIGGKIGETNAAGQTSATLHTLMVKGELRTVAIIILGSSSRDADVLQLLSYAQERFSY